MKSARKIIIIPALCFLVIVNIISVIYIVSSGNKIRTIEMQKKELLGVNQEIRDKLVGISSYSRLSEKAKGVGFFKPYQKVFLNNNDGYTATR